MYDTNLEKTTTCHNISIVIIELILGLSELRSCNNVEDYGGPHNFLSTYVFDIESIFAFQTNCSFIVNYRARNSNV